ncbi:hypothetical protein QOZ80_5BG0413470 [Eleusine coracana subsp. coracana]|nr:hypothetical protein QOZ80_5BG0413470 [Eleusine coracana subsp. coracana]
MDGSQSRGGGGGGGSSSPPPFLIKTYEMVEDPATNHVVSWGPGGASFVVWNPPEFSQDLLPKYFKHNNFSSFIRQLNTYGFRKIDPEKWEFANEDFIRGHTHLLKNIHRRKPVHSHSLQNQVNTPLAESERREYEDEINRLKYEKSLLLTELQKQNQKHCGINWQMQSLEDRLMQMEQRQKNIVASLCDILQRSGVVSGPLLQTDHFISKKRRVPKIDFFTGDLAVEKQQVPFLQTMGAVTESSNMVPAHHVNSESIDRMEMSLVSLEKFIQKASDASGENLFTGSAAISPAVSPGEVPLAPMETNVNMQSSTGHAPSSAGLAESSCYVQSPVLSLPDLHEDVHRTEEADMNSDTTTADTSQDEATTETGGSHEPTKVNDLFWERFLTEETPKFFYSGEVDSGRQEDGCKLEPTEENEDAKMAVDCSCLHHRDRVDQITEQMGQLASAKNA